MRPLGVGGMGDTLGIAAAAAAVGVITAVATTGAVSAGPSRRERRGACLGPL